MNTTVYGVIHQMKTWFKVIINTALSQAWMIMAISGKTHGTLMDIVATKSTSLTVLIKIAMEITYLLRDI